MHRKTILLLSALAAHPVAVFAVLFFGMFIEGDLLVFTIGFLIHSGALNGPLAATAVFSGVLIGDSLWYFLGLADFSRNSFLRWIAGIADKLSHRVDPHIINRTFRTLLISKFIYGTHHILLVRTGMLRVPYRKFLKDDTIGIIIWLLTIGGLGYIASISFRRFLHGIRLVEIGLLLAIVLFFLFSEALSSWLKKEL